jgi:ribosome recycling factor
VRVRRLRQAALDRLKKQEGASEDDVRRETKVVDEQVAAAVQDIAKLAEKKRLEIEAQ